MDKFGSTQEDLDYIMKPFNDYLCSEQSNIVTEKEVYEAIGLENGRDDWGWGNGQGFHKLSQREMHPNGCPCCGRPWNEASE